MSDLISRSALMEYCSNQKSKSIDNNDIARFPSAESVHEWIPCSERLPNEGEKVIVCLTDWQSGEQEIDVSYRRDCNLWHGHGRYNNDCVAWMPLPKPYREDDEV